MSRIYEYLKNKINDSNYHDRVFYSSFSPFENKDEITKYTYYDLYNLVNKCIELLKNNEIVNSKNKICFLIVNSNFSDFVTLISLMELGIKPILVSKDVLYLYHMESNGLMNGEFPYDIIESVNLDEDDNITLVNDFTLNKGLLYEEKEYYHIDKEGIKKLIKENINLDSINNDNYDFALLTSGTTGYNKVCLMKEDALIDVLHKKYDLEKEETYVCQNPISSISGLLFTLYLPIVGNNKKIYNWVLIFPDNKELDNHLNIIIPGNYFKDITRFNHHSQFIGHGLDDKIDQVTLIGTKVSSFVLNYLHLVLNNLPYGKIVNYYGRTENYGLVSQINEKDMQPLYLYYQNILPNRIIYSIDKRNIFIDELVNGNIITKRCSIPFNSNLFCELFPIANSNNINEDVDIKNIFGSIIVNNKDTDDYGIKFNNKIYLLGRKSEVIQNHGSYYYLSALEEELLTYLASNHNNLEQKAYCVNDNNQINIYVPCKVFDYQMNNYRNNRAYLNYFISEVKELNIKIDNIYFTNRNNIPYGCEIGKLRRGKLQKLKAICNAEEITNNKDVVNLIKKQIRNILNRDISFEYDGVTDYCVFKKSDFSVLDIAKILKQFKVLEFKEDSDNYYLGISDEFVFADYDEHRSKNDQTTEDDYVNLIKNKSIREFLLKKYNILAHDTIKVGLFYNKDNQLTSVVDVSNTELYLEKHSKYSLYGAYQDIIQKEFDYEMTISKCDIASLKYYFNHEFSIDEENNFYVDGDKVEFDYRTTDISIIMRDFLIKHKDSLGKEKKYYAKH